MRVRAYRNLNNGCISLTCWEKGHPYKGKVIAHVRSAYLNDCSFIISETGRQRVVKNKVKDVHAWVEAELVVCDLIQARYPLDDGEIAVGLPDHPHELHVTYNPYHPSGQFRFSESGAFVDSAPCAWVKPEGVFVESGDFPAQCSPGASM